MLSEKDIRTSPHRTWARPHTRALWQQRWYDALFMHWPVERELIASLLPKGLEPDTFEGKAWVSAVAFSMGDVRHRWLPSPGEVGEFHELNFRTYVANGYYRGVYFLSIEAAGWLKSAMSRLASGMPYTRASIRREDHQFAVKSKGGHTTFDCEFNVGKEIKPSPSDRWFTERYALFRMRKGQLLRQEIDHDSWPLREVEIDYLKVRRPEFGIDNQSPSRVVFSPGVTTIIWPPINAYSPYNNMGFEGRMLNLSENPFYAD